MKIRIHEVFAAIDDIKPGDTFYDNGKHFIMTQTLNLALNLFNGQICEFNKTQRVRLTEGEFVVRFSDEG